MDDKLHESADCEQAQQEADDSISVLIFEDDIDDLYIVRSLLQREAPSRFSFHHATNLQTGMQILLNYRVDIILLDLNLEDSAGLGTLEAVLKPDLNTPVIVLTGIKEEALGRSAIKMGAEDYIPKADVTGPFLARAISYSIERYTLREALKKQADHDSLTGIPNRSALFKRLDALIEQSKRHYLPLALMMIDLDGFKSVNDTHGHNVGDELLRQVAQRISQNTRKSDLTARLGGDEFVILLTNYHNLNELEKIATEKLDAIEKPFEIHINKQVFKCQISASIGVVEWVAEMSLQSLMSIADTHMYKSKEGGKGQISFAEKT